MQKLHDEFAGCHTHPAAPRHHATPQRRRRERKRGREAARRRLQIPSAIDISTIITTTILIRYCDSASEQAHPYPDASQIATTDRPHTQIEASGVCTRGHRQQNTHTHAWRSVCQKLLRKLSHQRHVRVCLCAVPCKVVRCGMLAAAVDSSWESLSLLLLLLQLHSRCYSPCDSSWSCDRSARRESLLVNRLARSNLSACACAFRPGAPSVGLCWAGRAERSRRHD